MVDTASFMEKYFSNDDGKFDPNDHIDKFALIYLGIVFISCIMMRAMGVI
ncbi:MAG TPA: hypothetical protein VGJ92_12620 [Methanocella sp.]|jgi:hypothetical protein